MMIGSCDRCGVVDLWAPSLRDFSVFRLNVIDL